MKLNTMLARWAIPLRSLVLVVGVFLLSGCASTPAEFETPPEVLPPVVDEEAHGGEDEAGGAVDEGPAVVDERRRDLSVVIEPGGSASIDSSKSLLEAAAAERERRRTAPPPTILLTNDNLAEHATGELTIVSSGIKQASEKTRSASTGPEADDAERHDETYWRQRVLSVRQDWHQTLDEIEHLESRVAELRQRFYAEDDPYYRDTQIKPSWDRTLERLDEARRAAAGFRGRVDEILEQGRREGALPGWLREGIELEPRVGPEQEVSTVPEHEPAEPVVVDSEGVDAP